MTSSKTQAARAQALDLLGAESPIRERLAAQRAAFRRGAAHHTGRTREARRRRRLLDAADVDVAAAGDIVRMGLRFGEREHRREAGIGALEDLAPFVARLRQDHFGEARTQYRPPRTLVLRRQ